ncbi:DNA polymerase III subunit alpha [Mycoplasmopsis agalactiae]|uniref:DNA-directed DNA polymerase n=1 Tax=Mycoplasmopsis agalactiae TaxID=2110 RepID=D3VPK4_MYCAA|nr:DNA polymerase III subunit alpha [Mycoplasmopsis agalactiae]KAB6718322.1 DNA polymerase III subunit alpha [Mycoplasmopsis agalactiae]CBH40398.1 DNA polymerase III, alpha subunit [Mycoplasmopsis agalactiae]
MNEFIDLYNTTEYSFLESLIKVKDLVRLSKENGKRAVVLSDHNNMFALGEFLKQCAAYEIKPIIGVDLDVEESRFILLAKNYEGFKLINSLILKKSREEIRLNDIISDNLFIIDHPSNGLYAKNEHHKLSDNKNYYISSPDSSIPNSIYVKENKLIDVEDNETLNILLKLGNNKEANYNFSYFEDYTTDSDFLARINFIVDNCNVTFPKKELKLASFCESEEKNYELFIEKIKQGLAKHKKALLPYKTAVNDRINYECSVIKKLGFINYFLIISDMIEYADNNGISIGPGRGSAAGSLISYLLGITKINPLKYNLLFERFLNIDKVSWPDIDIDIQDDRRDEIFAYLQNKYGKSRVAVISTFQTMGTKQAIRDVGRMLDIPLSDVNRISKSINAFANYSSIEEEFAKNLTFNKEVSSLKDYEKFINHVSKLQGLPRQYGIHAAGLIISDKDLNEYVPVFENAYSFLQVQVPMEFVEDFGLLKIDLLGLKTLTEIKHIEKRISKLKLFDQLVYENDLELQDPMAINLLNNGNTEGLFQIESSGMKSTIKRVGIQSFEDLFAIISLYRPGPKEYIKDYANNRKNPKLIEKIDPVYDEIVAPTYGIIIYQEQIMEIAQAVAKMSFAQADLLRRAISKKNEVELHKYRNTFFEGGLRNNFSIESLTKIYDKIEKFAQYGFNKSHAVSYAYLTMKMAYYKARYPQVYFSALISNSYGDQNKIASFVNELKNMNFSVYSPSIIHFTNSAIVDNGDIYLPFNMIKGLGAESIKKIALDIKENGQYKDLSLFEILLRLRFAGIKNSMISTLIRANVFRNFGYQDYISGVDLLMQEEYNLLSKGANSFADIAKNLDFEGYKKASENIEMQSKFNLEEESRNEIELLGNIYNAYKTVQYEKKYKYRLSDLLKMQGSFSTAIEIVVKKEPKDKPYAIIEVCDRTLNYTFFVNKNNLAKYRTLNKGDIIEAHIRSNGNKMYLDSWQGIQ